MPEDSRRDDLERSARSPKGWSSSQVLAGTPSGVKVRRTRLGFRVFHHLDRHFFAWAVLPAVLVLACLTVYPVIELIRMSLAEVTARGNVLLWEYIGLDNFRAMLDDPVIPAAWRNTFIFVVGVVVAETLLGLLLALCSSQVRRLSGLYRTILVAPLMIPPVAIGTIWRLMYDFDIGILNQGLIALGLPPQLWTASVSLALPSLMLIDVWHWTSFVFLILLAGVESIPVELVEAARVDGASELQVYRRITIPLLRPALLVAVMLRTIFAFKVFDEIYLLTSGGPGTATMVISLYIEEVFFKQFRMGYASAIAVTAAVTVLLITILYQRVILPRSKEVGV